MDSFYGGRPGRPFNIASTFSTSAALNADLSDPASPVAIGDYAALDETNGSYVLYQKGVDASSSSLIYTKISNLRGRGIEDISPSTVGDSTTFTITYNVGDSTQTFTVENYGRVAEAWAQGTMGGESAPAYSSSNAKYYSEQAFSAATSAASSASNADGAATRADIQATRAESAASKASSSATLASNFAQRAAASATAAESSARAAASAASEAANERSGAAQYAEIASISAAIARSSATAAYSAVTSASNFASQAASSALSAWEAMRTAQSCVTSATSASNSAMAASSSAIAAASSAEWAYSAATIAKGQAEAFASAASSDATLARSYARGGTGERPGEASDNAKYYQEQASSFASAAESALSSAQTAASSAVVASTSAATEATKAESYARGGTNSRSGEDTDNALYYKNAAQTAASGADSAKDVAVSAASIAGENAQTAEAWAVGKRNGVDVSATDPAYQNNAKYYKDQAQTIVGDNYVLRDKVATVQTTTTAIRDYEVGEYFTYNGDFYRMLVAKNQGSNIDISNSSTECVKVKVADEINDRLKTNYIIAGQKANTTLGTKATAEGEDATASGQSSHAEGGSTSATNSYAHAEGWNTSAGGNGAHAEGLQTSARGNGAHAEGNSTSASGAHAHAEGYDSIAQSLNSHAEGLGTRATNKSQHVFGEYNALDPNWAAATAATERGTYVEIVGNGTAGSLSNARTLDWSGNEVLAGKLTLGNGTASSGVPTNDADAATKKYVDDSLQNIDGANVNVEVREKVSILNTDSPVLGETVYFRDYPNITWQVQHLDGNYAYLALYPMTGLTAFGSSITYSGSTIASICTTFLNNTIPNVADYLEDVTVNGVTAKVFIPSYYQLDSEWDWPKGGPGHRVCQLNGPYKPYWTSTAYSSSTVQFVGSGGTYGDNYPQNALGFRPAVKVNYKQTVPGTTTKDLNTAIDDINDSLQNIDASNVFVTGEFVNPLNTDQLTLGMNTVYFTAYPSIKWRVDHLDGDYAYLGLYTITETTTFGSNTTYSGSTIAAKCTTFLNNTIPNVADYLESVTVEGVTNKVFIPTYYQMSGNTGYGDTSGPVFTNISTMTNDQRKGIISNDWTQDPPKYVVWLSSSYDSSGVWGVFNDGSFSDDGLSYSRGFRPEVKVRYKGTRTKPLATVLDDLSEAVSNVNPYVIGTTAPTNTSKLWIDTTATTGGLKYYNGSAWVHVPTAFTS